MVKSSRKKSIEEMEKKKKKKMISVVDPKSREKMMRRLFHKKPFDIEHLKSSSNHVNIISDKQQQKNMNVWKTKQKRLKARMKRFQTSQKIVRDKLDQLELIGLGRYFDEGCMFTNMEIRTLQSKGINSYHQFLMDYTKQQLIEQIKEIPPTRIRQVYHAVALEARTPGAYQSSDSIVVRSNIKVETTTTSSIAVFKDWIATNASERDQRACMGMHLESCLGIPVALCVCLGRMAIIFHLVHRPLGGSDGIMGLNTLGRGGVGCSPQTLQGIVAYLKEEDGGCCFPHVYFQEHTSMEGWSWVEETKLKVAQIVYLLSRAHEGYELAARAMWQRRCFYTIGQSIGRKDKCLVSPELMRITGETLLGIEKITELVWNYVLKKDLLDCSTGVVTCDEMLLLVFKTSGPLSYYKIKKLLKQIIKLPLIDRGPEIY